MFWKNKKLNYWVKKIDRIVTWFIIGWALASIFWLTHTKKWQEISKDVKIRFSPSVKKISWWTKSILWNWLWLVGKILAFFVWIFNKK